jgi:hypothetical protein
MGSRTFTTAQAGRLDFTTLSLDSGTDVLFAPGRPPFNSRSVDPSENGEMSTASYTLRRVVWILWAWEAERDGQPIRRGRALSRRAARWFARSAIRATRRPQDEPIEEVVLEQQRRAA